MENVIILGTGCAGFTAGIYAARANLNPLILEGKQPGGQLTTTSEVENFPGFPEGIDGYSLMDHLRKQALKFGARVEHAFVDRVSLSESEKSLFAGDKSYNAKCIIIATGAAPRLLGVPGEKDQGCLMITGVKKEYPDAKQSVLQKAKYEEKKFECKKKKS